MVSLTENLNQNADKQVTLPGWAIILLCLAPWVWIVGGLYGLKHYALTTGGYHILGCFLPFWFLCKPRPKVYTTRWGWGDTTAVITLYALALGMLLLAWWATKDHVFDWERYQALAKTLSFNPKTDFWPYAFFFVFINPVIEELFWRGLIYRAMRTHIRPFSALVLSSFFFGAWHWLLAATVFEPITAIGIAVAIAIGGMVFALVYEMTGGLLAAIAIHSGCDLAIMIVVFDVIATLEAKGVALSAL